MFSRHILGDNVVLLFMLKAMEAGVGGVLSGAELADWKCA